MAYTFNNNLNQLEDYNALSKVVQFEQCLGFLEKIGKHTLGKHFEFYPADYKVIFQLLVYFYADYDNAERFGLDLRKGILLSGPIGCGKTSLMYIMRYLLTQDNQYIMKECRAVGLEFIRDGHTVIEKYSTHSYRSASGDMRPKTYCFDDLGTEPNYLYYGNEANVMAEIILSRYPLFIHRRMLTHATCNLSSEELEKLYGNRVRSRMREMFNLIAFDGDAADKRK
jgi:DNA replication protein DnaC